MHTATAPALNAHLAAALARCSCEAERRVMLSHWSIQCLDQDYATELHRSYFGVRLLERMRTGDLQCAVYCEQIWIVLAAKKEAAAVAA